MQNPKVIDADGHIYENHEEIEEYFEGKYRGMRRARAYSLFPSLDGWPRGLGAGRPDKVTETRPEDVIKFVDNMGLESTVLYPTAGLAIGLVQNPEWACSIARAYNNWFHARYTKKDSRLKGVAILPVQDPQGAVEELRYAAEKLDMVGAFLPSATVMNKALGHPDLHSIFREAESLGVPLGVHGAPSRGFGFDYFEDQGQVHALEHPFPEQIRAAKAAGVAIGIVLADAGYGNETAWREALSEMELEYCVGVQSVTTVWVAGTGPVPPKTKNKIGRPATRWQRVAGTTALRVKGLAEALTANRWRTVVWREGSSTKLSSRFAALRVRAAHRDEEGLRAPRKEQWLLIEWPVDQTEPTKYWLATLPVHTSLVELVKTAKMRWRIERDYQELKQEFGLSHYEGRGWRGFHHHATLCIAAYGFLLTERLQHGGSKKNSSRSKAACLPQDYKPRGSPTHSTSRARFHRHAAIHTGPRHRKTTRSMPVLQRGQSTLMTQ